MLRERYGRLRGLFYLGARVSASEIAIAAACQNDARSARKFHEENSLRTHGAQIAPKFFSTWPNLSFLSGHMKWFPLNIRYSRALLAGFGALAFAAAIQTSFAVADDDRAADESITNVAKNLARMNYGAQIEWTSPDGRTAEVATATPDNKSATALIMDDETLSCPLQEGQTTFVIKLPTAAQLDRFTFVNENAAAAGNLKISVSNYKLPATSPKWVDVDGNVSFTRKRLFNLSMLGVEARYVKLSFNVDKPGRIAALGLYGGETLERFALRQQQTSDQMAWLSTTVSGRAKGIEDQLNFNFANLYAKAQVVHVSSGAVQTAQRMIDDDNETGFRFADSDGNPTVIVELAESERLHRISALYKMHAPGRFDVFLLNDLSESATDLAKHKPVASVTDDKGDGKAAGDFDPHGARYVALRWTPADSSSTDRGFEIAEINAFGDMPLAMLMLNEAPDVYASNMSALHFPGGDSTPDLSTRLGTVAIAPTIPSVSP